ncbi:MAG TPA: His/Gly/Thr/Pro-type tRNA ligase C-terminal domain-containing protein [Candidatus Paceibacterota bacterium]|nr:His/Gly/Thr/Pro-type tRNA ligase C-terminal domain-containing protein [Candidatus Paceibacterota bacterium]HPC37296.1 His/Gly/Thr/Pro-type tRNA ligase C-terminal domain-containing protein [Candidatus Paceibacterota bacterium]HRU35847.1 His/Gly/Thr/Pro-type tRNA ligase C-terminal domain-containing protein [Candidatus Paceibacterota bacterium]
MLQSKLFSQINRDFPKDEVSINAKFLIRAGFVDKVMAGVFSYLPLGWRVYKKVEQIIREEMVAIGGQEIFLPVLMPKELWEKTGRWESFGDALMKIKDRSGKDYVLGPTHEELITELCRKNIFTYRDLPKAIFQIQNKFRDEPRAKSGLLRGKEFMMKDLYSFHSSRQDLDNYYEEVKKSYLKIFSRCGLKAFAVESSGAGFTEENVHEFMVKTSAGEDITVLCELCGFAQNKELGEVSGKKKCPNCGGILKEEKTVEVGNIFKLGTKYSESIGAYFIDRDGQKKPVIMGCYGIGVGRLMGTIVEVSHDDKGIIWPLSVAPFAIHLIKINSPDSKINQKIKKEADKVYQQFIKKDIEILYDDREEKSAGEKFIDADLIGIPYRLVISEKTLQREAVEIKNRNSENPEFIKKDNIINYFKKLIKE